MNSLAIPSPETIRRILQLPDEKTLSLKNLHMTEQFLLGKGLRALGREFEIHAQWARSGSLETLFTIYRLCIPADQREYFPFTRSSYAITSDKQKPYWLKIVRAFIAQAEKKAK
jgi:hypothetical protein